MRQYSSALDMDTMCFIFCISSNCFGMFSLLIIFYSALILSAWCPHSLEVNQKLLNVLLVTTGCVKHVPCISGRKGT